MTRKKHQVVESSREIFQLGQRVNVKAGELPGDPGLEDFLYLLIGLQVDYTMGTRQQNFLLLMPQGFGWRLMHYVSPLERDTYYVPRELYVPETHCLWAPERVLYRPGIVKTDGAQCSKCKDFIYMANQSSDFVCMACQKDPFRCSPLTSGDDYV